LKVAASEVAQRFGVSRQAVRRPVRRYKVGGLERWRIVEAAEFLAVGTCTNPRRSIGRNLRSTPLDLGSP
jgi:transposase-like protein